VAFRRTSPRKADFVALGQLAVEALAAANRPRSARAAKHSRAV